jgi:hypothetical protein
MCHSTTINIKSIAKIAKRNVKVQVVSCGILPSRAFQFQPSSSHNHPLAVQTVRNLRDFLFLCCNFSFATDRFVRQHEVGVCDCFCLPAKVNRLTAPVSGTASEVMSFFLTFIRFIITLLNERRLR